MFGRLRSQDYVSWMRTFAEERGRWPFESDAALDFAFDQHVFIETYGVPDLARVRDATLELAKFKKKSLSYKQRNALLMNMLAGSRAELLGMFSRDTHKALDVTGLFQHGESL